MLTNVPIGIPWAHLLRKILGSCPTQSAHTRVPPLLAHLHYSASRALSQHVACNEAEAAMIPLLVPVGSWLSCEQVIVCEIHAVMPRGHCERHTGVSWAQADIDDASSNRFLREDASEDPKFGSWFKASSKLGMLQHMASQRQCFSQCCGVAKLLKETMWSYFKPIKLPYVKIVSEVYHRCLSFQSWCSCSSFCK